MSRLKAFREQQNLTQEELSKKSGISARTIQRIETGKEPKGYTRRETKEVALINYSLLKLINLSSIPFIIIPPLNIIVPFVLMLTLKQKNRFTKQLISLQILWTIIAPIVFMLGIFLKLGNEFTMILIILIVSSNVFIILRNAIEIDRNKKLYYHLNFSMI